MKTFNWTFPLAAVTGLALMGCPSDDAPPVDDGNGTTEDAQTDDNPTTTPPPDTDTNDGTTTTGESDTDEPTEGSSSSSGEPMAELPTFDPVDPSAYDAVDRMGFPAVNTALIQPANKDAYNASTPADDAAAVYAPDIITSLITLHRGVPMMQTADNTGLDDDLSAFGFLPCAPPVMGAMGSECLDQGAPFVLPDVLQITVGGGDAFPNGRRPAEPVMDIILAVVLLDLTVSPEAILTFVDLDEDGTFGPSLNPLENDVEFAADFPYLAPAHEM